MEKDKEESNIIVAVRIRPLNVREIQAGEWDVIRTQDNMIVWIWLSSDSPRSHRKIVLA
jgi:hypothetical protein